MSFIKVKFYNVMRLMIYMNEVFERFMRSCFGFVCELQFVNVIN